MKRALTKAVNTPYYYYKDGELIEGVPAEICGNLSGVTGDLSGITGNLSGITGNLSEIIGDLDACEITDEDRKKGIDVEDLIKITKQ